MVWQREKSSGLLNAERGTRKAPAGKGVRGRLNILRMADMLAGDFGWVLADFGPFRGPNRPWR